MAADPRQQPDIEDELDAFRMMEPLDQMADLVDVSVVIDKDLPRLRDSTLGMGSESRNRGTVPTKFLGGERQKHRCLSFPIKMSLSMTFQPGGS